MKKAYPTADMELKTLEIGTEVMIRDVTATPTNWRKLKVKKFVDEDKVQFEDTESQETVTLVTEDCEIDLPGESANL